MAALLRRHLTGVIIPAKFELNRWSDTLSQPDGKV
jgi:hypothetical protein